MSEEQKHLIISIALWAMVIVTVIIGIIAISSSGIRGGFNARESVKANVSSDLAVVSILPESTPEESAPLQSASSESSSSSQTSSQANPLSSQAVSSQNTPTASSIVDASAAATVTLYGGGHSISLTESQIAEFMALYGKVSVSSTTADGGGNSAGNGAAGFTITYGDGRKEGYTLGVVYDGIWHSGSHSYTTGISAYDLEAYLCQYPVISNQLNQTPHSTNSSQPTQESSNQQTTASSDQQTSASSGQLVTASAEQLVTASSEQQTIESSTVSE